MKARQLLASTSIIHMAGLVLLSGALAVASPAMAQAQEACPLPSGAMPPGDPRVTAQQVEDGSATLMHCVAIWRNSA